jgi:hypothetical protein
MEGNNPIGCPEYTKFVHRSFQKYCMSIDTVPVLENSAIASVCNQFMRMLCHNGIRCFNHAEVAHEKRTKTPADKFRLNGRI